ncbi:hypothetical protein PFISCL1PPCAC_25736, partial [Pristionchus fissidentatus]
FGRHFDRYQKCFHRERPECTPQAIEVKQRIEVALQQTYEKLVTTSHMSVPHLCSQWRRSMPADIVPPGSAQVEAPSTMASSSLSTSSSVTSSLITTTSSPPTTVTMTTIDYMVEAVRKSTSPASVQMLLPVQMTDAPIVTLNVSLQLKIFKIL